MKSIQVENYTCLVGGNAKENWDILRQAKKGYTFFHLSSFPSCYVILQTEEDVDQDILERCAQICLENTKYRHLKNVYVDCSKVENVKKGEKVGEIYYKKERDIRKVKAGY
jgi:predicted ribosome quality control (RQC) complex YloA/Tae2 family protein